jgi:manganese/iron transport system permease protein
MLITPAATAALLVRRLHLIMIGGALLGFVSSVVGLYVSYYASVASGASIVLVATAFFTIALVFSPKRGLLAALRHPAALYEVEARAVPSPPADPA